MNLVEFLLNSVPLLIQLYAEEYLKLDYSNTLLELESEENVPIPRVYDFIVVGGGSAGCVVAGRLSERYNVLLLEAGGTPPPAASVPYFQPKIHEDPSITNFYTSIPQRNSSLSNGGVLTNDMGKMLGGSGSHNDMIYNRGSPLDFDNWAAITNDPSWTYANVLKYFKKMENFIGHKFGNDSDEFYGKDGPLTVDTNVVPLLPLWFEAGKELGYEIGDPNGFQKPSFVPINLLVQRGKRVSSWTGYIQPFEKSRQNLTVIRYANVSEILLNENNEAYGVAYTRHGIPQLAYAGKEVVLSTGTFATPLLLMKSGIGPMETLQAANIPVKVQLESVGLNLGDHAALQIDSFEVNDSSIFYRIDPSKTDEYLREYQQNGGGPFSKLNELAQTFIVSSKADGDGSWSDLWLHMNPEIAIGSAPQLISLLVVLGRPKSTGSIRLNSTAYRAGVKDDPSLAIIDHNYLSHPEDLEAMLEGIKFAFKIVENTASFKSLNMTYVASPDPTCADHEFRSDDYWRCYIQQHTFSGTHVVGTCGMGSSSTSVVDSQLRVRGVHGLRIIDGSVMPAITNANVNAAILMIAEKAADEVLKFWSRISYLNI